jgi:hypothetical protein
MEMALHTCVAAGLNTNPHWLCGGNRNLNWGDGPIRSHTPAWYKFYLYLSYVIYRKRLHSAVSGYLADSSPFHSRLSFKSVHYSNVVHIVADRLQTNKPQFRAYPRPVPLNIAA